MREIEFRAWLKNEKRMITNISSIKLDINCIYYDNNQMFSYERASFDEIELMLGLKIYDDEVVFVGDVVRIYGGEQMFGYYEVDKIIVIKDLEDLVTLFNMDYGIDVLGNIYENPKLLDKE